MRGRPNPQRNMLAIVDLVERVPKDHPLRWNKEVDDAALERLSVLHNKPLRVSVDGWIPDAVHAGHGDRTLHRFCAGLGNKEHGWRTECWRNPRKPTGDAICTSGALLRTRTPNLAAFRRSRGLAGALVLLWHLALHGVRRLLAWSYWCRRHPRVVLTCHY